MLRTPDDRHEAPRRAWRELTEVRERAAVAPTRSGGSATDSEQEELSSDVAFGRQAVRDMYFGVADITLRRLLIEKHLAYFRAVALFHEDEVSRATIKLHQAERMEAWSMAAGVFVVATIAGAFAQGLSGAVFGAVCGAGIGWATRQNARRNRLDAIAACRESLEESRRDLADIYRTVPDFTDSELASGVRDPEAVGIAEV